MPIIKPSADGTNRTIRSSDDYNAMLSIIVGVAHSLAIVPFDEMQRMLDTIDTTGPIMYPTEYRAGMHKLEPQRAILKAARNFLDTCRREAPKIK